MTQRSTHPTKLGSRGIANLLHLPPERPAFDTPLLVVASPIARWRHLAPSVGPSLLGSCSSAGFPVYCLDWGEPIHQDRDVTWREMVARVAWARDLVLDHTGARALALLGFSLGGTLSTLSAALEPRSLAALINLSGPIDFEKAGAMTVLSDARWFDPSLPAAMFRCTPPDVMSTALALHRMAPTRAWLDHFGHTLEAASEPMYGFVEAWAQQHVPLPPRAYETYVRQLIQQNQLARGRHYVDGRLADLTSIHVPVLAVGARRDAICRHPSSTALVELCGSSDATALVVPGGHIGSIVGRRAERTLHAPLVRWLSDRCSRIEPGFQSRGPARDAGVQPPS